MSTTAARATSHRTVPAIKSALAYTAARLASAPIMLKVMRAKSAVKTSRAQSYPRLFAQASQAHRTTTIGATISSMVRWASTRCHAAGWLLRTADLTLPAVTTMVISVASSSAAPAYMSLTAFTTVRGGRDAPVCGPIHGVLLISSADMSPPLRLRDERDGLGRRASFTPPGDCCRMEGPGAFPG